jgi:hypothetical protein
MLAAASTSLFVSATASRKRSRETPHKMLVALAAGLCLRVVYGILKDDSVLANSIGATLALGPSASKHIGPLLD